VDNYAQLDLSIGYDLSENLSLSFEGLNLTDEAQDQRVDSVGRRLSFYHHQGRQYYLGARFKY